MTERRGLPAKAHGVPPAAWLLKWLLLHAGGLRLYRAGLPLFIGLIIGHFTLAGILWPRLSLLISPEASAAYHLYFG